MDCNEFRLGGLKKFQQPASDMTMLEYFTLMVLNTQKNEEVFHEENAKWCVEVAENLLCEIAFAEKVHKKEIKEY